MPQIHKIPRLATLLLFLLIIVTASCDKEPKLTTQKKDLTKTNKLLSIGHEFYLKEAFDSSYYYYNKAKNEAEIVHDTSRIIHALGWMAEIQTNQGDYNGSESTSIAALPYFGSKGKFLHGETNIYIRLGNTYLNSYEYKKAIYFFRKAINSKTDTIDKANIENNIALALTFSQQYKEALSIFNVLLAERKILNDQKLYSMVLNNLGLCLNKTGNKDALTYFNKSLKIKKQVKDQNGIIDTYYNLSEYYKNIDTQKSTKYALIAYNKSNKKGYNIDNRLEILKTVIQNSTGPEYKKHALLFIKINDSIIKVRQKAKNTFAKIKYDTTQEKEENKRLKEQKAENLLQLELQNYKTYGLYLIILIILITTFYTYFYLKSKNNREKIQASYLTELQIAKKLHDELANDVYQTMKFVENEDLSSATNKEVILQNLDNIYTLTRNISIENNTIETGIHFKQQLKEMLFGFNTNSTNIIINNIDAIDWTVQTNENKITLYRVLQELLVNMKKHSQCSIAVFSFTADKNKITVNYTDNGLGANLENTTSKNGLQNMENRIKAIKGTIAFDTAPEKGFKVHITFPA